MFRHSIHVTTCSQSLSPPGSISRFVPKLGLAHKFHKASQATLYPTRNHATQSWRPQPPRPPLPSTARVEPYWKRQQTSPNQEAVLVVRAEPPSPPEPKPPAQLVRIIHYQVPNLTYTIHIRDFPLANPPKPVPWTTHTASEESDLFDFASSVFAFSNSCPFRHFIGAQTPANIATITRVQ